MNAAATAISKNAPCGPVEFGTSQRGITAVVAHPGIRTVIAPTVVMLFLVVVAFYATLPVPPAAAEDGRLAFALPSALAAPDGQSLFEQKCKACHTIGGGRSVGPDLKGISGKRDSEWLVRFTAAPDRLIAQEDLIAKELVAEFGLPMPNLGVSEEEARAIIEYIDEQSGVSQPTVTAPVGNPLASDTAGARPEAGKLLFTGKARFQNGGASCLSCHNAAGVGVVGGGTTGKDLTPSYSAIGEAGLTTIMKTAPFPMMKEIYGPKPLLDDEIASVVAFLGDAETAKETQPPQSPVIFFALSAAVAVVTIAGFQFWWRGRLSGVRRPLVKGGSR